MFLEVCKMLGRFWILKSIVKLLQKFLYFLLYTHTKILCCYIHFLLYFAKLQTLQISNTSNIEQVV